MSIRNVRWLGVLIVAAAAGVTLWSFLGISSSNESENEPTKAFDGASNRLQQTIIVPTLDTVVPERKSAVWCISFQLAWNRLKSDLAKEPIRLANAPTTVDRLNTSASSEDDVNQNAVYATAGLAKDGVVDRIRAQMADKFPNVQSPQFDVPTEGAVAYAYLQASAKFEIPFFENDEAFPFTDSAGKRTSVGSFGIRRKDDYAYRQLRQQVQILYCPPEAIWSQKDIPEFVLDPCRTSQPYQIVLARVDREPTLQDTLAKVERKIAAQAAGDDYKSNLGVRDTLLVPNIVWKIAHRFAELEGRDKQFLNPALRGLYLDAALQTIDFRLDRSGAELASEAKVYVKPGASYFHVNRPFLLYLKKRDGKRPFFVMWVDNAELLEKKR